MVAFCDHFKENGKLVVPDFEGGMMPDGLSMHSWSIGEISGREALQRYGTEGHRDVFGSDFWVDQVLPHGDTGYVQRAYVLIVITDCRFPNEAARVLQQGGEVWRINRDEAKPAGEHASEVPLDDLLVSREIDNNGTLKELEQNLRNALTNARMVPEAV
jgi:hypothetical protein